MKHILLLIICFGSLSSLKAQSVEETLEWLKVKKIDISVVGCSSNTVSYADTVLITADQVKISTSQGAWTRGNWSAIKEVKLTGSYDIQIVFDASYENKPLFINLRIYSEEMRNKYMKAIKHMATLKGAKMIDSDLF